MFKRLSLLVITLFLIFGVALHASAFDKTRPGPKDQRTKVSTFVYVMDVDSINAAEQSFSANVFYALSWKDKRIAPKDKNKVTYPVSKIWTPGVHVANQKRISKVLPEIVTVDKNGNVVYRQRVWGTFSQPLTLHNFPFDRQIFNVELALPHAKRHEVNLVVDKNRPSGIAQQFSLPDWEIIGWNIKAEVGRLGGGVRSIPSIKFSIHTKRFIGYYIFMFMLPLTMILFMSWIAFWIDPAEASTRIGISVVSILTLIIYRFLIGVVLPRPSYAPRLDVFILGAALVMLLALALLSIMARLVRQDRLQTVRKVDVWVRWMLPILFIVMFALVCVF